MKTIKEPQLNDVQKESLRLIDEHFENVSNDDFLKAYFKVEKGIGPTVEEFFASNPLWNQIKTESCL